MFNYHMRGDRPNNRAASFLVVLFVLLFIIVIVGIVGFFYLSSPEEVKNKEGVTFWLYRHPTQITGDENTFFIFIKNQEVRDIMNAQIVVNFPDGFVLSESRPQCNKILANSCQWQFEQIKKGTLQEIEIVGRLYGTADQMQFFTGSLHFQLQGFTSEFEKNFSSSVMINPALHLSWDIDTKGSLFDPFTSTLTLENITSEYVDKARVILQWPYDFDLRSATSQTEKDIEIDKNARILAWDITDLDFYDKKELIIRGEFIGAGSEALEFSAQAGMIKGDDFFIQVDKIKKVELERFDFVPELKINNVDKSLQIYSWGDTLPVQIGYVNNTNEEIKNATLLLEISANKYIDTNRLYTLAWSYYSGLFIQPSNSPYLTGPLSSSVMSTGWDKTLIPALSQIPIGGRGVIMFDLPLKQSLDALKNKYSQAELSIRIIATGTFNQSLKQWKVRSNEITIKINTHIAFEVGTRYYDDEGVKIGTGPLPPEAHQETTYWIFINIKNTTNSIENVSVVTRKPKDVLWKNQTYTTHGLLLYNEDTREISWQIDELPLYVGGPYSLVEARVEVGVVPTADSVGLFLPLTKEIIFRANDRFTQDTISSIHQFVSTDLNQVLQKDSTRQEQE
ncbi:hypothetical protein MYX06_01485 [Patescibacteria group bacterium AH-259-L05]|nr:hypothetical protein [Patescibacteria group bacterium AH-259-L05]